MWVGTLRGLQGGEFGFCSLCSRKPLNVRKGRAHSKSAHLHSSVLAFAGVLVVFNKFLIEI